MLESLGQWFMGPDNQRLFLGLIIAFGFGLVLGAALCRSGHKKGRAEGTNGDEAFLKGVHYILSNDHDHAIEEFTKSVQVNSDTIETYVALGNLYRSKGDIERAIRIRKSIILRPNLDAHIRLRALVDLGYDYRKGGFFNRSLSTFLQVIEQDPSNVEVLEELERLYEEMKDWDKAFKTRQKISRIAKGDHKNIMAHHLVESGKAQQQAGDPAKAKSFYNKAISTHKECVDAYLHLGDLHFQNGDFKKAISIWEKIIQVSPRFTFLAYNRLEGAYAKMKDLRPVEAFLKKCAEANADAFTHLAIAKYRSNEGDIEGALKEAEHALELAPSLWEAARFKGDLLLRKGNSDEAMAAYTALLERLDLPYLRFQCANCGFEPSHLQWQCPQCKKWDTIRPMDASAEKPVLAV
ncbi:MAG: tetratricopeptide repeat protein [Deltaproteobacteria bacterium]|nr:tetratricopeptide repeat protein [Deltaproteobacteria bacterium]